MKRVQISREFDKSKFANILNRKDFIKLFNGDKTDNSYSYHQEKVDSKF